MVNLVSLPHKSGKTHAASCVVCQFKDISDFLDIVSHSKSRENVLDFLQAMEANPPSPTSPTSPVSSLSPISPRLPATPTSPCFSRCQPWEVSAKSSFQTPIVGEAVVSFIQGPDSRRTQSARSSKVNRSFAERMKGQSDTSESCLNVRDLERRYTMTLCDDGYVDPEATMHKMDVEDITTLQSQDDVTSALEVQRDDASLRYARKRRAAVAFDTHATDRVDLGHNDDLDHDNTTRYERKEGRGVFDEHTTRRSRSPTSSRKSMARSSQSSSRSPSRSRPVIRIRTQDHVRFRHPVLGTISYPRAPKFHLVRPVHTFPSRIQVVKPEVTQIQAIISHLTTVLLPLVSVTTGLSHPDFPCSILQYHLLTHGQLDSLAQWYHQTIDAGHERWMYPTSIRKPWVLANTAVDTCPREGEEEVDLNAKRRWFGRFIGLRGCESPTRSTTSEGGQEPDESENLAERMEREWRAAMRRAEEEARLQEKVWRGL